ncbi:MAG: MBOAT family protein [Lachnospiraceae bacterium]|nr:MBOAT family protein [Lachnospiraceae bacterium]
MTFSSLTFLFMFLPVTFVLYVVIRQKTVRNIILAAASLIFYAFGEPVAVIIMVISVALNYLFGLKAAGDKGGKWAVFAAVVLNIGLLAVYKYAGFLMETLNGVTGLGLPVPQIRLPIGISFFTFQGLSYVIDVYRHKEAVQKNLFYVLLYISFFPQLIAGPIVRYQDIAGMLKEREFSIDRVSRGICRFIFGLGKKVLIANQMGMMADTVFAYGAGELGTGAAWIGAVCYALQIYFDFSGYSDMAIGLGCIFGFDFKENFDYPYIAPNIRNFWRRWHISLSTWFKEYVYIPLGGSRRGRARTALNKLIVFFLTGLWHGANFTFIVWGMIHGLCQMLETYRIIPTRKKWFRPLSHVYTLLVVILAFVIFRADSLTQGFGIIRAMFSASQGVHAVNVTVYSMISPMVIIAFIFAVVLSTPVYRLIRKKAERSEGAGAFTAAAYILSMVIFVLSVLALISNGDNPFIYFRF